MPKANIDKNENACHIEVIGNSLEAANDLCILIYGFARSMMTKHTKIETLEIITRRARRAWHAHWEKNPKEIRKAHEESIVPH